MACFRRQDVPKRCCASPGRWPKKMPGSFHFGAFELLQALSCYPPRETLVKESPRLHGQSLCHSSRGPTLLTVPLRYLERMSKTILHVTALPQLTAMFKRPN